MIETFGIPDYAPAELLSTDDVRERVGEGIGELVGAVFDGAWLMWDFSSDEWVEDAPIIVCLGGHQLELCLGDRQETYVSIDEIDRGRPLAWFDGANRPYQWVSNPTRDFQSLSFRRLERFGIGESAWASGGVASYQPWSIELDFGDAHLALERGDDTHSLRFRAPQPSREFRVVWL